VTMTKSGEVNYTSSPSYDGEFFNDDTRPRNIMVPQGLGYTVMAAV